MDTGRRKKERLEVNKDVNFILPKHIRGRIRDFTPEGIGVEVSETIGLFTPIKLEMFGGDLVIAGEVAWTGSVQEKQCVGIEFSEEDQIIIENYLDLRGHGD